MKQTSTQNARGQFIAKKGIAADNLSDSTQKQGFKTTSGHKLSDKEECGPSPW